MQLKKNQLVDLTIESVASDGNGVGRIEGMVIFVPFTAPGDVLRVQLVKVLKNYCFGIVREILRPSPDRREDGCPVYHKCGGCCYRHVRYESELLWKQQSVTDNFKRLGGIELDFESIVSSGQCSGYRNKAQYPVAVDEQGHVRIGFFARRSHRVMHCTDCDLQPAFFAKILDCIAAFIEEKKIPVYDEKTHKGLVRHVYLRHAEAMNETMVCLVLRSAKLPFAGELVERLRAVCDSLCSVVINVNPSRTNVILGERCVTLFGSDTITDVLCGVKVQLSPRSFYQVNRRGAELLYQKAAEFADLQGNEVLLDLYCGAGTIGLSMAHRVKRLVGVEVVAPAVENARQNARINGTQNAAFLCDDAAGAVRTLAKEGLQPDVVILDPPRKGCGEDVVRTVAAFCPQKIVMISCNSATAARDCKLFGELGYAVTRGAAVDLFARTAHVECVVLLEKAKQRNV